MFEIEKDVKIPAKKKLNLLYPFPFMEVGDSFLVKKDDLQKLHSSASYYRRRTDKTKKFTIRSVPDGARCWRIE